MKISLEWLKQYCKFDLTAEEAARRLTMSGLEVEGLHALGSDWILTAEVTSNRPDLLCHIGVARELSALTGAPLIPPPVDFDCDGSPVGGLVEVTIEDFDLCPRYTARVIRGVKIGPSPAWLADRLEAIGLRPINNVVDITNFVLMETGQPLHAFDLRKLRGPKIVVRRARKGERIVAIDGSAHELSETMLVIADAERPVAVAGVMGGLETEVGDTTTDLLLESALFNAPNIRRTSRALKLESDSSYRFERGVDPDLADWASRRAAHLIKKLAGGSVAEGVADVRKQTYQPATVTMRTERFRRLIGVPVDEEESAGILSHLGFTVKEKGGGKVTVLVPSFRAGDVYREVDLIEEVARICGYDKIPDSTPMPICVAKRDKEEMVQGLARDLMVAMGYSEAVSFTLTDPQVAGRFAPWGDQPALQVANPMAQDRSVMRRSLLPGLLQIKRTNERQGARKCALFELSHVYLARQGEKLPEERLCLGLVSDGDLRDVKGAVETLLDRLGLLGQSKFLSSDLQFFDPSERARVELNGVPIGCLGRIGRETTAEFDLRTPCCVAEMDFSRIAASAVLDRKYVRLPSHPPVERDLAIIVDEGTTWAEIREAVEGAGVAFLKKIEFFDLYRGKPVPEGRKSLAFSLVFRSEDRTLIGEEVNKAVEDLISLLGRRFSAELRKA